MSKYYTDSTPSRDSYYDFLKGFSIIMVIGIHTFTPPPPIWL